MGLGFRIKVLLSWLTTGKSDSYSMQEHDIREAALSRLFLLTLPLCNSWIIFIITLYELYSKLLKGGYIGDYIGEYYMGYQVGY